MKDNIKLALFFVVILGAFTILLCTESSSWFSASVAMILIMSGVFLGLYIVLTNFILASGSIAYLFISHKERTPNK